METETEKEPSGTATGTAEGSYRSSTPESVLFINTADQSLASQASSRKKARSHIMNTRHKKARKLLVQERNHNTPASDIARVIKGSANLHREITTPRIAPMGTSILSPASNFNSPYSSHFAYTKNWTSTTYEPQEASSIIHLKPPRLSRLGLLGTFPFQLDHRDQKLLFHYCTVFNYTNIPVNSKEEWMKFAISDAALLHTTLIISALHVALLRAKISSVDAFRHQIEAVKTLDARLNDPVLNISDPTILAISCLALIEILNASPLEAALHLNAIEELVKERGGLQALGFNGIVRRKVLWADLSSAIAQQTPPRFPYPSAITPWEFPADTIHPTFDTSAANFCTGEIYDFVTSSHDPHDICTIIHDIQYLSLVFSSSKRTDITKIDQLMLSDRFYDIERRTYDLLQAEGRGSPPTAVSDDSINILTSIYKACCLTAMIYVSLALREIPARAGFYNPLIERLTTMIQDIDILKACTAYPKMLLWILGTGGAASLGRKGRGWYVKQLADFCQERKVYEWDVTREAFGNPMHLAPAYIDEMMEVWNEVEEFKIMRDLK